MWRACWADARRDDQVAGTPEYVAPERFLGAAYDHRADIYALGVLAYETLTGQVPFRASSYVGTLTKHVEEAPPPLKSRVGDHDIPEELAAVVMQLLEKDPDSRPANMAVVEAMLCEAQIAARLRTGWDDLELPSVDELWRKKLAARMPSPWGTQKKALVAGALTLALTGAAAAIYFGVLRAPEVEVRYVEVTRTDEAGPVAAWLERAEAAAREQRYVKPASDSALTHILRAEAEHARLPGKAGEKSKGAEQLRRMFASALVVVGDELTKANLAHLAVLKYREALLFTPDDAALAATAQLTQDETKRMRERVRAARGATAKGAARAGRRAEARAGSKRPGRPPPTPTCLARGTAASPRRGSLSNHSPRSTATARNEPSWPTPSDGVPTRCGRPATRRRRDRSISSPRSSIAATRRPRDERSRPRSLPPPRRRSPPVPRWPARRRGRERRARWPRCSRHRATRRPRGRPPRRAVPPWRACRWRRPRSPSRVPCKRILATPPPSAVSPKWPSNGRTTPRRSITRGAP